MAADAALISSFGKLADAGKRDYSRQLQLQKEGGDILTEGITKTADIIAKGIQDKVEAEQEAYKKQNEEQRIEKDKRTTAFAKNQQKVSKNLEEGGGLQKDYADLFWYLTGELKEEFDKYNTQGDDSTESKKARAEVMTNVTKLENKIVDIRSFFQIVGEDAGDEKGESNISPATSTKEMDIIAKCSGANGSLADNGVVMEEIDGEIYYNITTPESTSKFLGTTYVEGGITIPESTETYSFEQIQAMYTPKNIEGETAIIKNGNNAYKMGGKTKSGDFDLQAEADDIAKNFKTPKQLADLAQRRLSGRSTKKSVNDSGRYEAGSWASDLQDHPSLNMAVYQSIGVEVDTDGDGEVSQAEAEAVMNGPNRDKVIDALVNPENPDYNHVLSTSEISMWIAEQHAAKYYKGRSDKMKEDGGNNKKGSLNSK